MKTCYFGEFEDKLAALYNNKVRGFILYNGQEAVLAGALHNGLDKR
jgi:hypothetical protein